MSEKPKENDTCNIKMKTKMNERLNHVQTKNGRSHGNCKIYKDQRN